MSDWNHATEARLRQLWTDGLSCAAIGRAMKISKNAVVGKIHRLGLTPRMSPIRARTTDKPIKRAVIQRLTKPVSYPVPVIPLVTKRVSECQWPLNDERPWRFCCAEAAPGRSYCAEHARRARANSHEATPTAIANMIHRPSSGAVHPGNFEEIGADAA